MPRSFQREPDGVAAALAIHLSLYCAVAALFALVLFYFMQPTRLPNPGMAAHKSSPVTLNYVEVLRSEREAAKRNAEAAKRDVRLEPEAETTGAATREAPEAKPETKKAKAQSRPRPARRQQQQPPDTTHYAQQPFGAWRPMY